MGGMGMDAQGDGQGRPGAWRAVPDVGKGVRGHVRFRLRREGAFRLASGPRVEHERWEGEPFGRSALLRRPRGAPWPGPRFPIVRATPNSSLR